MSAAFVQGTFLDTTTLSSTAAVTLNGVAAGSTLILVILSGGAGTTVSSVSDGVNTWARVVARQFISGAGGSEIWAAYNVAAGNTTVTSTISSNVVNHKLLIHEVSGLLTAAAFDVGTGATGNSTTPSSGATATTAQANEYVFGFLAQSGGDAGVTEDAAFTLRENATGASASQALHSGDRVVAATGTFTYAPSIAVARNWVCLIGTFKAAAAAGNLFTPPMLNGISTGGPFFSNPIG